MAWMTAWQYHHVAAGARVDNPCHSEIVQWTCPNLNLEVSIVTCRDLRMEMLILADGSSQV